MRRRGIGRLLVQGLIARNAVVGDAAAAFGGGSGAGCRAFRLVKLKEGQTIPAEGLLPLNALRDNEGARQPKTRLGRGIGSGKGKTAGRGHKGQKARSGRNPRIGFEGGQTPLRLRIPKRGFNNHFGQSFKPVNLETITDLVKKGRLNPSELVTMKTLKEAGALGKKIRDGVKLLGKGSQHFNFPLNFEVSRVSERAKAAVEAAGGTVTRVHYNELGLKALLDPTWFEKKGRLLPQPARPPLKIVPKVDATGRLPSPLKRVEETAQSPGPTV